MHTATSEYLALLGLLIKHSVEAEALSPLFKLKQAVLLVLHSHYAIVAPARLMVHEGSHTQCDLHPLTSDTCHHRIPVEGVHLGWHTGTIHLHGVLVVHVLRRVGASA